MSLGAACCLTPASLWPPETRSAWLDGTAPARRACSRSSRAKATPPADSSYAGARSATGRRSHGLGLLDSSITRVLHLDAGRLIEYRGTYSQYQAARRLEEKRLTSLAHRQEAEIKRLSLLAEVMRRQTQKRAKQAKSIFTRVERMKAAKVTAPRKERKVKISFPEPPHSGRIVLHGNGLAKGYGGPLVFRDVTFEVERHQRLLVMGLNGAGKTSLLRILAGESEPNSGSFR